MPAQLALYNFARARGDLDDPVMAGFTDGLGPVNSLADRAPGFVWRLQDEHGTATSIRVDDDPRLLVNVAVWESPDALKAFTYRGEHGGFFRRRLEWFEPAPRGTVLWWVPEGHRPGIDEAVARWRVLQRLGPTPAAFTFASVPAEAFTLERALPAGAEVGPLIAALDAELEALSPEPGSNFFFLGHEEVAPGRGVFLLGRLAGSPVATGAVRLLDDGAAEVKRMFVRPEHRGRGLAAAVLAVLEEHARTLGATRLVLETGDAMPDAHRLYVAAGFEPCPCWGEYAQAPRSVCFAKSLS